MAAPQVGHEIQLPDLQYLETRSRGQLMAAAGTPCAKDTISPVRPLTYPRGDQATTIGEVTVRTTGDDDGARIEVIDDGVGISPELLPKVFDALFSTKTFGVGFGRSLVQQIAEQHGGKIEIASEPGKGARAVLFIPLRQPAAAGMKA